MLIYLKIELIPLIAKLNFQQPLIESSVSHDPSEIIEICWFGAQDFFLISVKSSYIAEYFRRNHDAFLGLFDMYKV